MARERSEPSSLRWFHRPTQSFAAIVLGIRVDGESMSLASMGTRQSEMLDVSRDWLSLSDAGRIALRFLKESSA